MNRKFASLILAAVSVGCMLTSCGKSKLKGQYELCTAAGMDIGVKITFKDDNVVEIESNGVNIGKDEGTFKIIDKDTLSISGTNDKSLSGEFDYRLTDKNNKGLYIKDVSEKKQKQVLDNKAFMLYTAVNNAMLNVSIQNSAYYNGTYMVTSDGLGDYVADGEKSLDPKFVMEAAKVYLSDINDMKYVVVINNNNCVSAACSVNGSLTAGVYPPDGILNVNTRDMTYRFTAEDRITVDLISQLYQKQLS